MKRKFIPLTKPYIGKEEVQAVINSLSRKDFAADGYYSKKLSLALSKFLTIPYVYLTPSCSSALELAIRALGIGKDDEIILPSFTFTSTANAVMNAGAKVVFAEIEKENLALDPTLLEKYITKKTKAILFVWYGGWVNQIEEIITIAKKYNLFVIEDAACALGTKIVNKYAGTFGDIGCFSFHETKNVICGEGGALVTRHLDLSSEIDIIRNHGTNRAAVLAGMASSYQWIKLGGSYLLSDILASLAFAQFKKIEKINNKRRDIALLYLKNLGNLGKNVWLPTLQVHCVTNWHTFAIRVPAKYQLPIIFELKKRGVRAAFHYLPLHSSPFGKKMGFGDTRFPVTSEISSTIIRLPIYPSLTKEEVGYISKTLRQILAKFSLLK